MKKKRENGRLGSAILRSFMLFSVVPMLLASLICIFAVMGSYEKENRREMETSARNAGREIGQWLMDMDALVSACARDPEIQTQVASRRTLDEKGRAVVTALLFGRNDGFQLHILSENGVFRYSTGSIPNLYKLPAYSGTGIFRALQEDGACVRATHYTAYNGKTIALSVGRCVFDSEGAPIGYVILDVTRDRLASMLSAYNSARVEDVILIGQGGTVAYSRSGGAREGVTLKEKWALEILDGKADGYVAYPDGGALKMLVKVRTNFMQPLLTRLFIGLGCIAVFAMIVAGCAGKALSKRVSRQLDRLIDVSLDAPASGFTARYERKNGDFGEIVTLGERFNEMNVQTRELIENIGAKQRLLANAELNVLKAQMRPHFIYNVLNDIKAMAKLNRTREIVDLVVSFSALMRSSLSTEEEFYTVAEEMDLVSKYVRLQNLRGAVAVDYESDVDEELLGFEVPRLILQPLVENAFAHGLPGVAEPKIRIEISDHGSAISLRVCDNGRGFCESERLKPMDGIAYHKGIGLANVSERLKTYYGDEGYLRTLRTQDGWTVIAMRIPKSAE